MKAKNLKTGHVLVDPDGHLYEVMSVICNLPDIVHVWLWPDSSPVPNYFQSFEPEEDIVAVQGGTHVSEARTEVIPVVDDGGK